jgi:hypothetical protein
MAGAYIVALELVSRVDIDVEADSEEDAIQKAFVKFDSNFEFDYATEVKLGEWEAEIVEAPKEAM